MNAIVTDGLGKRYSNGVQAVVGLSLAIERGTIFGFLGPNGSGKTTTVRLLNGTLLPTEGSFTILGLSSSDEQVRMRTSTLAELAHMYDQLSVYDNLLFYAQLYGLSLSQARAKVQDLLSELELWDRKNQRLGTLSTGLQKRVYLARTLVNDPEVIFLDEPTAGLDPDAALQVTELVRSLARQRGTTIFLCTHNLALAERICDSYGFLHKGRLVASGSQEALTAAYLDSKRLVIETTTGRFEFHVHSEAEINPVIRRVMDEGALITGVRMERPDLEALYFHYIKRSGGELAAN